MIDEVGTSCSVQIPSIVIDAFGNHVSTTFTTVTEVIWVRQLAEQMQVEDIGQQNFETLRFIASYNTSLIPESKITYQNKIYTVISIDIPDEAGVVTHKVGTARRELT